MYHKNTLPELLAPAGDMECLYAAVAAGADAIYVGGKRFGARAFAKNFDIDELSLAVEYCHLHRVKLYVTVNTLIEDKEMAEAVAYARELYRIGVDALIVADVGLISALRRYVPDLELHASTQLSAHSTSGVEGAASLGASRAVVARELSLTDIKSVVESSSLEIEVFLHGALCVCHSGQCLFSSIIGGRSGNRGECAQPCRLPYNGGKYPLSLKDLALCDHIPALIESGVASLKIEGRMKSPDYVYTVTSIYRKLLDEGRAATAEEFDRLRKAFSRSGFTDGYFTGKISSPMTGIRSDEDKKETKSLSTEKIQPIRHEVKARVRLKLGEPSEMEIYDGEKSVTVYGTAPVEAQSSPLDAPSVTARLAKMGNTFLSLNPSDIELTLDSGINLPPSALNALRRDAAAAFQSQRRELEEINYIPERVKKSAKSLTTAQFFSEESFLDALAKEPSLLNHIDIAFLPLTSHPESLRRTGAVYLPPIILDSELCEVDEMLENAKNQGVMYALVSNIGQIELVKSKNMTPIGDFRLNVTNIESRIQYEKMGVSHLILSPELTLPKARDIGGGLITYGRIPLMITERCFISDCFGCKGCKTAALTDRKGEKFPMRREFSHRNIIFNSLPTYMGDKKGELSSFGLNSSHLIFSVESGREIVSAVKAHSFGEALPQKVRRVGRR